MLRRLAPTLVRPRAGLGLRAGTRPFSERTYLTTSGKESDPLRILFCGSDDFSRASLEALYREQERNPELIRSIDVVVRPAKRVGRGRKLLREGEIPLPRRAEVTYVPWIVTRTTFGEQGKQETSRLTMDLAQPQHL